MTKNAHFIQKNVFICITAAIIINILNLLRKTILQKYNWCMEKKTFLKF